MCSYRLSGKGESNLIYHLSNCTVSLQEQVLSLPVGGGDALQVLLNSQGSESPFLIHLQALFHSREETWPISLCLLYHYTRVVSILLVEKRHSKNPQCSTVSVCNKEQPLRWGRHGQKGEPRCLSRVSSSSVRDLIQGGSVERFERDKCSQKVKLFEIISNLSQFLSREAADFLSNPAAPLR